MKHSLPVPFNRSEMKRAAILCVLLVVWAYAIAQAAIQIASL